MFRLNPVCSTHLGFQKQDLLFVALKQHATFKVTSRHAQYTLFSDIPGSAHTCTSCNAPSDKNPQYLLNPINLPLVLSSFSRGCCACTVLGDPDAVHLQQQSTIVLSGVQEGMVGVPSRTTMDSLVSLACVAAHSAVC